MRAQTKGVIFGVVAVFAGLTGCAAVGSAERATPANLRGTALVTAAGPRFVVAGPTRLLHVDTQGRSAMVYKVVRLTGTEADCRGPTPGPRSLVHGNRRTILDIEVPAGQVVCLVAADSRAMSTGPAIEVSWHARSGGEVGASPEVIASNR